ncbi:hypothetical protein GPECTOR_2g1328 [Gonium pectorale]|uniref:Protein kinase domain-containing protein n=1 Tax=Gonium pectorale TaxID=33097 RepID=A0A150H1Q6_GONPE|nr:hypothetical protein GPECTOR_2g1328 [Gonium pectorale]|eukprot:KXZ55778.1 hypothetical protein GPECTOR_2g1328 [Gonium pectorale]
MRRPSWSLRDYDIMKRIYKGCSSAVYQAICTHSGLPVALKVYFLSRVPSNAMHMIAREVMIHADMNHKSIITLYSAFQEENRLVLVQEWAGRGDLYGVHRAMRRRMTEAQEAVLLPFLEGLAYLHARGICHRDIKPENILFTADWKLKLADFGVSIDLNNERAVTRAGTLDYMAPEVERCPMKVRPQDNKDDPRLAYSTAVDVWATGVLTYELLVGFPPFVADTQQHQQHASGAAPSPFLSAHATRASLSFPASMSAGARDFISLALAERPEERPTAVELLQHPWMRRALQRRVLFTRTSNSAPGSNANASGSAPGSPGAGSGSLGTGPAGAGAPAPRSGPGGRPVSRLSGSSRQFAAASGAAALGSQPHLQQPQQRVSPETSQDLRNGSVEEAWPGGSGSSHSGPAQC